MDEDQVPIQSSNDFAKSVLFALRILLFTTLLFFLLLLAVMTSSSEGFTNERDVQGLWGLLVFGALDGAFLFWASRHYFLITADKKGFVRHAKKEELRYAWSEVAHIKIYTPTRTGAMIRLKLKDGISFYTNSDLPNEQGNILDPNFSTEMTHLLQQKKKELGI